MGDRALSSEETRDPFSAMPQHDMSGGSPRREKWTPDSSPCLQGEVRRGVGSGILKPTPFRAIRRIEPGVRPIASAIMKHVETDGCIAIRLLLFAYPGTYNTCYNHPVHTTAPTMKLKITTIGNSAGVILPKELMARLRLEKGDELYLVETADGIRLSQYDPKLAAQMDVAEQIMREDRNVLHKLAQ